MGGGCVVMVVVVVVVVLFGYGRAALSWGGVLLIGANLIAADRRLQRYRGWFWGGVGAGQYLGWSSTSGRT